jgi:Protein of unknown function (DUF4232)
MPVRTALSSVVVMLAGAMTLTACHSGTGSSASPPAAASQTAPSASASAPAPPSAPAGASSSGDKGPGIPTGAAGSGASGGSPGASGSGATSPSGTGGPEDARSDGYAWHHPCSSKQITVTVTRRAAAPTQRLISVRNNGTRSCGLSYYPTVVLYDWDSATGGTSVTPLVPDGLGGPPASPVYAGRTAYAVIDLDPSGATKGTVPGTNEMNVLADGDHMPNRETLRFALGEGTHVLRPKLGLYEATVADAVASMRTADIHS